MDDWSLLHYVNDIVKISMYHNGFTRSIFADMAALAPFICSKTVRVYDNTTSDYLTFLQRRWKTKRPSSAKQS